MTELIPNPPLTADQVTEPVTSQPRDLPAAFPIGEDGDWLVVGHPTVEQAIAAIMHAANEVYSFDDFGDVFYGATREEIETQLRTPRWGVFTHHQDDCHRVTGVLSEWDDPEDEHTSCICEEEFSWWVSWRKDINSQTPGALPILVYES